MPVESKILSVCTSAASVLEIGGGALKRAANDLIERGKNLAAHMLEAATDDMEFVNGTYRVARTDKAIPLVEVAKFACHPMAVPNEFGVGLSV